MSPAEEELNNSHDSSWISKAFSKQMKPLQASATKSHLYPHQNNVCSSQRQSPKHGDKEVVVTQEVSILP